MRWCVLVGLLAGSWASGQQAALRLVVDESERIRQSQPSPNASNAGPEIRNLQTALKDWIESQLPPTLATLDASFPGLEARLNAQIETSGIADQRSGSVMGLLEPIELLRPAGNPDLLIVKTGISVFCGNDRALFIYLYRANSRFLVLQENGASKWGSHLLDVQVSAPDRFGSRIIFAVWDGVQCMSVWNRLDYRLFRLDPDADIATRIFSDEHEWVIENELHVKLDTEELLLEFVSGAMEGGFRRTHLLHYKIGARLVERTDPVALQPQDFVHEWTSRPWAEMEGLSSSSSMEKWHKFLVSGTGSYTLAQPCSDDRQLTQIGVEFSSIGDRNAPQGLNVYFLVRDKGGYRYQMEEIGFERQAGCPGKTLAVYDPMPSLFGKK